MKPVVSNMVFVDAKIKSGLSGVQELKLTIDTGFRLSTIDFRVFQFHCFLAIRTS